MSKESKQNNDPDILEEYDFSQGVRGKYYKRHYGQEMTKKNQIEGQLLSGAIITTVTGILNLVPHLVPVSLGIGSGFLTWQTFQLNKFQERVRRRLIALDEDKLDKDFLESDEFISLVVQAVEAASKTASEIKQKTLANVIANSVVLPTSKYKNKEALLRIVSQMSNEEMQALKVLYDEEHRLVTAEKNDREENKGNNHQLYVVKGEEIAQKLGWKEEDTRITCEGLSQLALIYDRSTGFSSATGWRISTLAKKLIEFSQESVISQKSD
ncbi:MAG: hypothetical protein WA999_08670 [Spirulinaceae cyanobacterium]